MVKPKFAESFRGPRFTRRNHCVQILATFTLTLRDFPENQEERPGGMNRTYNSEARLTRCNLTYFSSLEIVSGGTFSTEGISLLYKTHSWPLSRQMALALTLTLIKYRLQGALPGTVYLMKCLA